MNECNFETHLDSIRKIYKHKASLMQSLIDEHLLPHVTYNKVQGGLFIWATLKDDSDMLEFCKEAVENKVAVVPGTAFLNNESSKCSSFRLNFSTPTDEQMINGMEILGKVIKNY